MTDAERALALAAMVWRALSHGSEAERKAVEAIAKALDDVRREAAGDSPDWLRLIGERDEWKARASLAERRLGEAVGLLEAWAGEDNTLAAGTIAWLAAVAPAAPLPPTDPGGRPGKETGEPTEEYEGLGSDLGFDSDPFGGREP